jgi:hypothetical protein
VTNVVRPAMASNRTQVLQLLDVEKRGLSPIQHVEKRALGPS